MAVEAPTLRVHGNAYNIFILVLTVFSLVVMVLQLLPLNAATIQLLGWYDNVTCVLFLADFAYNLSGSRPRRAYFIRERGWLDLLGSIPTLGFFQFTALFRLARLSRLARITRLMGGQNRKELVEDVVKNRGQYATFITLLLAGLVISATSIVMVNAESRSPEANITSGGDAIWWALVTITTVGYGDKYPVTMVGRATAVFVMFAGVGIIGALASILASLLVPDAAPAEAPDASAAVPVDVASELALLRAEIAQLRSEIAPPASGG